MKLEKSFYKTFKKEELELILEKAWIALSYEIIIQTENHFFHIVGYEKDLRIYCNDEIINKEKLIEILNKEKVKPIECIKINI